MVALALRLLNVLHLLKVRQITADVILKKVTPVSNIKNHLLTYNIKVLVILYCFFMMLAFSVFTRLPSAARQDLHDVR
jgi:hypothetical protein